MAMSSSMSHRTLHDATLPRPGHYNASVISDELRDVFGDIDIYLFDQLLRGRFDRRRRILDAGCGTGRNLPYFLTRRFEVFAVDTDADAVRATQALFARVAPRLDLAQITQAELSNLPFSDGVMDAVVASAVLHFASDREHFDAMAHELWRVLAPGGLLFARLASSISLEDQLSTACGRVRLPDGSERFVVDERALFALTDKLGGRFVDPLKTTNVQGIRAMTTWVVEK
jgi:tellurite methyltransferase